MYASALLNKDGETTLAGLRTRVPWWSFTKVVLAIAALRLVEQGALALDEPVDGELFTLRQLLRHEAGLPDYGPLPEYHAAVAAQELPWPVSHLLAVVTAAHPAVPPGTAWTYSNLGYLKVSQLIAQASGLPLGRALNQLVFRPAGLRTARLATQPGDLLGVQMGGVTYHPGWVYHGLVVGMLAEAAQLLRHLLLGTLLQPATLAQMLLPYPLPRYRTAAFPDPGYGLGLMLAATNPLAQPLGHSGEGPGSRLAVYALGQRVAAVWAAPATVDVEQAALQLLSCDAGLPGSGKRAGGT